MKKERLLNLLDLIQENPTQTNLHFNSRILIVDGMNTFLRSFAALNKLNLSGNHVGGLIGFLMSLGSAIKHIEPTRVICVFDGDKGSTNRKYLYPEYKGNRINAKVVNAKTFLRKEDEDDAKNDQIVRLIDYLKLLPISLISIDTLEADDIIGYLSTKIYQEHEDSQVYVMSSDNDFLQLVNDRTFVWSPSKKITYDGYRVQEEFLVHPENFTVYKALVGDSSDNIPGVTGIGEKNVSSLFEDLKSPNRVMLSDIYQTCQDKPKKSVLYDRVLNAQSMVEIFYQIVNIREPNITDFDREDIDRMFNRTPPQLKKYEFVQLYHSDRMSESIPNVTSWIDLFSNLNVYANNRHK